MADQGAQQKSGDQGCQKIPPPPPLRKHGQGQKNNGRTGSPCLDKPVLARDAQHKETLHTENLPGLCLVILGGGGQIRPPGFWLTHPPTHIRKFFLRKKMKFIKGARTWRSILGTQTFFWPLTHPPTPPPV